MSNLFLGIKYLDWNNIKGNIYVTISIRTYEFFSEEYKKSFLYHFDIWGFFVNQKNW